MTGTLRQADNQCAPARQFLIRNFRQKSQVDTQSLAFLAGRFVEKVNYVSSKSIFGAAAFVKVKGAYRIDFDLRMFAQHRAQLALEVKRSLPHLRHGERNYAIRHSRTGRIAALTTDKAIGGARFTQGQVRGPHHARFLRDGVEVPSPVRPSAARHLLAVSRTLNLSRSADI